MFKITTNKEIRINKGDDSGKFPIFINRGTASQPIRYEFLPRDVEVTTTSTTIKSVTVDSQKFRKKFNDNGFYTFYYDGTKWKYDNEEIDMKAVGIKYAGKETLEDTITAQVSTNKEEIYFYIINIHGDIDHYLVKKTFTRNGYIITKYSNKGERKEFDPFIINNDGDMELRIDAEDTCDLPAGEYRYVVKARTYNSKNDTYEVSTIIDAKPFYIIQDSYSRTTEDADMLLHMGYGSSSDERTYVESVNGQTGVVVLNHEDVGADKVGSAAQALVDAKAYTDEKVTSAKEELNTRITSEVETLNDKMDSEKERVNNEIDRLDERIDNVDVEFNDRIDKEVIVLNARIDDIDYPEVTFTRNQVLSKISQDEGLIHTETRELVRDDFDTDFFAEHQVENLPEHLSELEEHINDEKLRSTTEEKRLDQRINDLNSDTVQLSGLQVLSKISESQGIVSTEVRELSREDFNSNFFSEDQIENLPEHLIQIQNSISDEITRATKEEARLDERINDLNSDEVTLTRNQVLSKISESEGKVNIETRELVRDDFDTDFFAEHQIEDLPEDLDELRKKIDDLDYTKTIQRKYVPNIISQENGLINVTERLLEESDVDNLPEHLVELHDTISKETDRAAKEESRLNKRIDDLDAEEVSLTKTQVLSKISQTDGVISTETRELVRNDFDPDFFIEDQIENLPEHLAELQDNIDKEEARAEGEEARIDKRIDDLDYTEVTFTRNQVLSKISQTDGKISTTSRELIRSDFDSDFFSEDQVEQLPEDLAALNKRIDDLDFSKTIQRGYVPDVISQTNGLVNVTERVLEQSDVKDLTTRLGNIEQSVTDEAKARGDADTALDKRLTTVEGKISPNATSDNPVMDKEYVDTQISISAATFRGTYDKVEDLPTEGVDKNDYAFVKVIVERSTVYDKYKYTGTQWLFEYRLNNSSFTTDQWAAINSGITTSLRQTLTSANSVSGYGWKEVQQPEEGEPVEILHKIDPTYIDTKSSSVSKVLTSDGNGTASWQTSVQKLQVNGNDQPNTDGVVNLLTDGKSVLYNTTTRELELPSDWQAYLKKQCFKIPYIETLTLKDSTGTALNSVYELGKTYTVGKIDHKEVNISNIDGKLKFNNTDDVDPSATAVEVDTTDVNLSSTTTLTLSGKYTDTVGVQQTFTKSATITFNRYAYVAVTNSATTPTSGTKKSTVSTFASTGSNISYNAGDYIYFYTTGTGKTVQVNIMGTWADVTTESLGSISFTQENGVAYNYDCYRVGPFLTGGSDTYRV